MRRIAEKIGVDTLHFADILPAAPVKANGVETPEMPD
jgi:hypothetical protein